MGTQGFGAAVFILTEMALSNELLHSGDLALRLRMDGGVTRRILLKLARHGMVRARRGPGGGTQLAKGAREITLLHVQNAVEVRQPNVDWHDRFVPVSAVGRHLPLVLAQVEADVERATDAALAARTIGEIAVEVERRQYEWRAARSRRVLGGHPPAAGRDA